MGNLMQWNLMEVFDVAEYPAASVLSIDVPC